MNRMRWSLVLAIAVALVPACRKTDSPVIESKSESKATNPDGSKTTTTTEEKQVGSTVETTTETRSTGENAARTKSETVVGTVTALVRGKTITVMTGDGDKHSFDLADKKTSSSIDRRIAVGSKVQLDATTDRDGRRTISVAESAG